MSLNNVNMDQINSPQSLAFNLYSLISRIIAFGFYRMSVTDSTERQAKRKLCFGKGTGFVSTRISKYRYKSNIFISAHLYILIYYHKIN